MSNIYREKRPLLCDDVPSDEELRPQNCNPYHHGRLHITRRRIRNKVKGAANIISRWPEHWSSTVGYWWVAIGMLCLVLFVLYNGVMALSMLPHNNSKPSRKQSNDDTSLRQTVQPEVFMHIFTDNNLDVDLNKFMLQLDPLIRNFPEFKFSFIVVLNDTDQSVRTIKYFDNEVDNSQNTIPSDESLQKPIHGRRINIQSMSLTKYLDESPLKKTWRFLPSQLIPFLVRAVAIWDKGGIAVDPFVLLPSYRYSRMYVLKVKSILGRFGKTLKDKDNNKEIWRGSTEKVKPRQQMRNIQDIINALEKESNNNNNSIKVPEVNLVEDENRVYELYAKFTKNNTAFPKTHYKNNNLSTVKQNKNMKQDSTVNFKSTKETKLINILNFTNDDKLSYNGIEISNKTDGHQIIKENDTSKRNVIENIPAYNFGMNVIKYNSSPVSSTHDHVRRGANTKSFLLAPELQPMIIPNNGINRKERNNFKNYDYSSPFSEINRENKKLVIDLKGKIIATETSCHAFIGTMFSNTHHNTDVETITDFIIRELSMFCKGLLSTCKGIEVILL